MPDDLEDFEIEPTRRTQDEDTARPHRPKPEEPGKGPLFPLTLAAVGVAAIGLLAIVFLVFRNPSKGKATPSPAPLVATARPSAPPAVALPPLGDSDGLVRRVAGGLSTHPELARWLARTALVRTLTAVVVNVASGETPRPHLEFLAPKERFRPARRPGRPVVPDPAGFAGYDLFADAVASLDAPTAASAFRTLAPLFEAAYVELGHPEGGFPQALDTATRALLAVPVLPDDVELVPHAIGFRYVDPKLEALTPAQKQLLRIGPRNVRLVQGKLRELAAALAASPPATAPGAPRAEAP